MSEATDPQPEDALGKVYDARLMRRLLGYVRPYRGRTLLATALILVSSLLQLVGPLVTAVALDLYVRPGLVAPAAADARSVVAPISAVARVVGGAFARMGVAPSAAAAAADPAARLAGVAAMAALYLVALSLGFGVLYAQGYVMQMMGQEIMFDLRRDLFEHLQRLPVAYFDRHPLGRLVTRVTGDVDALNELFTSGLVAICGDIAVLFGIMGVLFWLDWRLAVVTFAILPLLLLLTLWFKSRARDSFREVRTRIAAINAFLQEHITGMAVLQLFAREPRAYADFANANDAHRKANLRGIFYYAVYYPGVELITALGTGLILWYGGGRVIAEAISVGALIAFLQYAQRFYQPLADLSEKFNILQGAMASSERIFALLDTPVTIASPAEPFRPESVRGEVELAGVSFAYKAGEPVLRNLSFRIAPGETVAVVGHTGAGKSTLANLLLRFYDVDAGAVRVDGVDVRQWDLPRLRRSIAMVLQDVFLFSGTIGANIRLGEAGIDDERLRWAAREVHALDLIERLPGGFSAQVRERGAGLSVGQKQLIAFARALAFDPRILILDEATSSIDTETEQHIQAALERLLVGRTSLVIAHRLSTVQRADRILVMHRGELREQGTHQELLALRGIYWRLFELQYKGQRAA
jgi:ATP-binding cassette subfamily B protein